MALNVVCCISNPCAYKRRYDLALFFFQKMKREPLVRLFVVELCYGSQDFQVTSADNPAHLQVRAGLNEVLWHKENLINMGVHKLLPEDWQSFAWIDADVEFLEPSWVQETIQRLQTHGVVQLFTHALDLDARGNTMQVFSSFCYRLVEHNLEFAEGPQNYPHPGFAWAMRREAFMKAGGLYDLSIQGSGDHNMAMAWAGKGAASLNDRVQRGYKESLAKFEAKCRGFRLGYVPGVLKHFFHGSKKNRRYNDRWQILVEHAYEPWTDLLLRPDGLLVPASGCPPKLLEDIFAYFAQRNEDEGLKEALAI